MPNEGEPGLTEVTVLSPKKSDQEIADGHRKKILEALAPAFAAMNAAQRDGFYTAIQFGYVAGLGFMLTSCRLEKHF